MGTVFRVTEGSIATGTLDNLQLSLQAMQNLQNQLSSGRRINQPSDDPIGTTIAMQYQQQQARNTQYSNNSTDAVGWLGSAESSLQTSVTQIQRVQGLVIQGANGTSDPTSRRALSDEIGTISQTLVGLANTQFNNRSIFAGTANPAASTPPLSAYDANGSYNGNAGSVNRTVGANASVQVNFDGPSVFGTDNPATGVNSIFTILKNIQQHLTSPVPADQTKLTSTYTDSNGNTVPCDLDQLSAALTNIQNRESEAGARYDRVQTMQTQAQNNLLNIQVGLSNDVNIDLPKTIMNLQLQNTAYQAALSATAKAIQPSLVNFLS